MELVREKGWCREKDENDRNERCNKKKTSKVKKAQAVVQETKSNHLSTFLKRQNASFIQQINVTEILTLCNHSQSKFLDLF